MEQEGIGRQQQWPSGSGSSKIKKNVASKTSAARRSRSLRRGRGRVRGRDKD